VDGLGGVQVEPQRFERSLGFFAFCFVLFAEEVDSPRRLWTQAVLPWVTDMWASVEGCCECPDADESEVVEALYREDRNR